ncbi:MAG: glycine zipper 2TM domain-containing protein [bacterium]
MEFRVKNLFKYFFFLLFVLTFFGCGKHEATGGAVGAASGAVVGEALSGDKSKGGGTLLGAVIGNYIGRKIGRSEDRKVLRPLDKLEAQDDRTQREEMQNLKEENRYLRKNLKKWCDNCHRNVSIAGANNCPYCGNHLIREKFCKICGTTFNPESNYRYCPYCSKENVHLSYR